MNIRTYRRLSASKVYVCVCVYARVTCDKKGAWWSTCMWI